MSWQHFLPGLFTLKFLPNTSNEAIKKWTHWQSRTKKEHQWLSSWFSYRFVTHHSIFCTNNVPTFFGMRPTLKVQEGWPSLFWESQFTGGHFVHSPLHINCARRRQGLKNQWVIFSGMSGNESLLENDCVWTSRV